MAHPDTASGRAVETKAKIIRAATRLSLKKGYNETTVRDICSAANISIGAFYHHFPSKQELLNQAFLMFDTTLLEEAIRDDSAISSVEALKAVLLNQTAFIVTEAGNMIAQYYQAILKQGTAYAANPERLYYRTVCKYAREALSDGSFSPAYSAEYITEFFIKFVRGCMIDWCLHECCYDILTQTERELDLLFQIFSQH